MALEVLVVDDEADIRELVSGVLEDEGYAVRTAGDSSETLEAIEERRPSMVLLDVWLQGSRLDGLQLLQEIKRRDSTIPVLMISGHGNLDTAVAAVREGAVDFIEKPVEAERLSYLVARAPATAARSALAPRRSAARAHGRRPGAVVDCEPPRRRDPRGPLSRRPVLPPQCRPGALAGAARTARAPARAREPFPRPFRGGAAA